jgi:GTP cyclohydrolase II
MKHEKTDFKSIYGHSIIHCFNFGDHEEDNILVIEKDGYQKSKLVRLQSACYTAEIFRATDCDCHEQLDQSLKMIHSDGGLLIYMLCDGRGAGLLTKFKALSMWNESQIDTHDAYKKMNINVDPRTYDRLQPIVDYFNLNEVNLLTNNPRKVDGFVNLGCKVNRISLEVACHLDANEYLRTKKIKMGHLFKAF